MVMEIQGFGHSQSLREGVYPLWIREIERTSERERERTSKREKGGEAENK